MKHIIYKLKIRKKENITLFVLLFFFIKINSQVGINTNTPNATLEVVGSPENTTIMDGIIVPKITGDELKLKNYTNNQLGALVYVKSADSSPNGQTINVITQGFYFFDGTVWNAVSQINNIYENDGTLAGNRMVTMGTNTLTFSGNTVVFTNKIQTPRVEGMSDYRYKKNIQKIFNPLEKVLNLNGYSYNWKNDEFPYWNFPKTRDYGLIAQDVEKILPELVSTDSSKEGYKSIAYDKIIPILIEAIKEQQSQINKLKKEVEVLKSN